MGGPGNRDVPRSLSLRKLASQPPPHAAQCNADVDDDDDYWDFEPTPQLMKVTTTTTPAPARAEQPASSLVPASPSNLYGAATSSDAAAGAAPAPLQEERVPASPVAAQECPMHVNDVASEGDDDNNEDDDEEDDDDDDEGLQWGGESDSDGALDSFDGPREGAGDFAWDDEDDEHQRQPQHQRGDAHGEFGAPSQLDVERYDNYAHDFDYDDVEEEEEEEEEHDDNDNDENMAVHEAPHFAAPFAPAAMPAPQSRFAAADRTYFSSAAALAPWRRFFISTQEIASGVCCDVVHIDYAQVALLATKGGASSGRGTKKAGDATDAVLEAQFPVANLLVGKGGKRAGKAGRRGSGAAGGGTAHWKTERGVRIYVTAEGVEKRGSAAYRAWEKDKAEAAGAGAGAAGAGAFDDGVPVETYAASTPKTKKRRRSKGALRALAGRKRRK